MRISHKIGLALLFIAVLTTITVLGINLMHQNLMIERAQARDLAAASGSFRAMVELESQRALGMAETIAGLPDVQEAFAAGNRNRLRDMFVPGFSQLRDGQRVSQFQFHLPPATSFLRVHQPDRFGDDLSSFRHSVVIANRDHQAVMGLERGVAGLGIRGISPVRFQGRQIGTVEIGLGFDNRFVEMFKARTGTEVAVVIDAPASGKAEIFSTLPEAAVGQALAALKDGEAAELRHDHLHLTLHGEPLRDLNGQVIGRLLLGIDSKFFDSQRADALFYSILSGALAILTAVFFAWLTHRSVSRPMDELTETLCHLANGELTRTVPGQDRKDEIGRIARALRVFKRVSRENTERAAELEVRTAQAEAALIAKSRFLAIMSHEFRTPLNGILGMLTLAYETPNQAEREECCHLIERSALQLLVLVNDVLDFSALESGKLALAEAPFSPRAAVFETLDRFRSDIAGRRLRLESEVASDVPAEIVADERRFRQVLVHLVANAIKFTPEGEIRVSVGIEAAADMGDLLAVSVKDSGIGIEAADQARIFDPFEQTDMTTTRRFEGAGLGLALCRDLVRLWGGALVVESLPGEGSVFRFTMPLRTAS